MTALTTAIQDSTTMIGRELKHTLRFPLLLVSTILVPVVMLVLFDYILGGPIGHGLGDAAHGAPYVDFLVPGIILLTVAAGCGPAAINVHTDVAGGYIDRIRTMAVTRGALLAGHVGGSVVRSRGCRPPSDWSPRLSPERTVRPCRSSFCCRSCRARSCRPTRCPPVCAGSARTSHSLRWWTASAHCSPARSWATPSTWPWLGAA